MGDRRGDTIARERVSVFLCAGVVEMKKKIKKKKKEEEDFFCSINRPHAKQIRDCRDDLIKTHRLSIVSPLCSFFFQKKNRTNGFSQF